MKDEVLKSIDLWEALMKKKYQADLELSYRGSHKLHIFKVDDLVELHKVLGVELEKFAGSTYMYAIGKIDTTDVMIYPVGAVFPGCKLIKTEVMVPETVVPAHVEVKYKVECGE